jgi:hypothetical protein
MDQLLIAEILTSDSDEIADLKSNLELLDGLIDLCRKIDELPNTSKRFYEESRSLYQATSNGQNIEVLESLLSEFFGPPIKPACKPLPRKMQNNSSVNYLGGIQKDQSLFLISLKTGEFYGALWPWRRNKEKIEIHLGYCSDWISDEDYIQIQTVVKRSLSRSAYARMDTGVGGQIRGISLPSFLQMAEMERSTLTLRISAESQSGRLFLRDGNLIDADLEEKKGWEAACHIISWDNAVIDIEPADETREDVIKQPLMHVLMESLKIKDETGVPSRDAPPAPKLSPRPSAKGHPPEKIVRLERAPTPQLPRPKINFLRIGIAVLVVVCIAAGAFFIYVQQNRQQAASERFERFIHEVDETTSPRQKLSMLEAYLQEHPHTPNLGVIQDKMLEVNELVENEEFDKVTLKISNLNIDDQYEQKAIALYSEFLEKYPNSRFADKITKAIGDIKNLLDQYYYEELKNAARLDFAKRTEIYRRYLARYPKGRFRQDVETLVEEMGRQYLDYIKSESAKCDQNKKWEPCIERCESFIDVYKGTPLAQQATALRTQLEEKRDLRELTLSAEAAGTDFQKAYSLYKAYLDQHPASSQKTAIEKEITALESKLAGQRQWIGVRQYATNPNNGLFERIQRLDAYLRANISGPYSAEAQNLLEHLEAERQAALRQRQIQSKLQEEQARLQQENEKREQLKKRADQFRAQTEYQLSGSSRYRSNGNGTVTDSATGLTWTLLDVFQELGGCLTHEAALAYVRSLRTGGYTDWRLPTASELASIYKKEPFYPASGAEWYWTSEAYAKGFHTVADIVTAKPETVFEREDRPTTECGSVRAVRN